MQSPPHYSHLQNIPSSPIQHLLPMSLDPLPPSNKPRIKPHSSSLTQFPPHTGRNIPICLGACDQEPTILESARPCDQVGNELVMGPLGPPASVPVWPLRRCEEGAEDFI
ncbi:hypothetical protein LIA77_10997 [Sarocladium implicatum]|nr:hypothetical protein LIA77_10997 [Sarocladium implicatum]